MVNNINERFDEAVRNLTALVTTPEQLQAVEVVRLAREELSNTHLVGALGDVARFFGVAEQTVRAWRLRADPMPGEPGAWDLSEITRWRIRTEQSKHRPRNENEALANIIGEPGSEDWKDRWLRAKALMSEEQLAEVQGKLVDLDEIAPILRRTATMLADAIRRLEVEYGASAADIMRTPLERMSEEVEEMVDRSDDG